MPHTTELRFLRFLNIESEACKTAIADGNDDIAYKLARMLGSAVIDKARSVRRYEQAIRRFAARVNATRSVTAPKLNADKILAIKRCWFCDGQIRKSRTYPEKGQIAYELRCRKCNRVTERENADNERKNA